MTPLRTGAVLLLALGLSACARDSASTAPPTVRVVLGDQTIDLKPTQFCDGRTFHRYDVTPPVIAAAAGTRMTFTVPASVAAHGWSVQVYDQKLEEPIGEAAVPKGARTFDKITMSDPAPSAFYLVVVEKGSNACHQLAGSWPAGFIRAGSGGATSSATPSATPTG